MHIDPDDLGTVQVVLERFEKVSLPRLLVLRDKVNEGLLLGDFDLEFLEDFQEDLWASEHFAEKHADFQKIVADAVNLYHQITEQGLKNQEAKGC